MSGRARGHHCPASPPERPLHEELRHGEGAAACKRGPRKFRGRERKRVRCELGEALARPPEGAVGHGHDAVFVAESKQSRLCQESKWLSVVVRVEAKPTRNRSHLWELGVCLELVNMGLDACRS